MLQTPQALRYNALKVIENCPPNSKCPSINNIAKRFRLSEATLRCTVKKSLPNHSGPAKILTEHEKKQLTAYCLNMQKLGFGLTRSGVNHCVIKIIHLNKKAHPFDNNEPGKDW